jgi:putative glutamine amidotransferase
MRKFLPYLICSILILATMNSTGQIRIAVSKTSGHYEAWLRQTDPDAVIVNMYGMAIDSSVSMLSTCSGLLLTGGEDVNPVYYDKKDEILKCEEIDDYRDSLELALIGRAILVRMPVFGICRGEQILNVALGGTLLTDIPTDAGTLVNHRCPPGSKDCLHTVTINPQSMLFQIAGKANDTVNSSHHQAVDIPAPGLIISAVSENGVAEAIEREYPLGKSYIMGVQWHPERLIQNPDLSRPLADNFLEQIKEYRKARKSCCAVF